MGRFETISEAGTGGACRTVTHPRVLTKMAKMKRFHHYRVYLSHGSYYSLSAANVKQAICQARTTARKVFGFRKQASLTVERIQRPTTARDGLKNAT